MNETLPRVEVSPPDIGPYRVGNTGVDWVSRWVADAPGPHVAIVAAMHGNEPCGSIVLDLLHRIGVRPQRGSLTLAFANVAAYLTFDPARPTLSRFLDQDMNRIWGADVLNGPCSSVELARARALHPHLLGADVILDLHSMLHESEPLILCGPTRRGADLARAIGFPGWIIADSGHAAGQRLIDMPPFGDPDGQGTAILVECGQHWERRAADVALETTIRLLDHLGVVDPAVFDAHRPSTASAAPPKLVMVTDAVTVASDRFRFLSEIHGLQMIPTAGTLIAWDGDREIRTPYDECVLIMPSRRVKQGQTAVRLGRIAR
jgi:predicted deacylase